MAPRRPSVCKPERTSKTPLKGPLRSQSLAALSLFLALASCQSPRPSVEKKVVGGGNPLSENASSADRSEFHGSTRERLLFDFEEVGTGWRAFGQGTPEVIYVESTTAISGDKSLAYVNSAMGPFGGLVAPFQVDLTGYDRISLRALCDPESNTKMALGFKDLDGEVWLHTERHSLNEDVQNSENAGQEIYWELRGHKFMLTDRGNGTGNRTLDFNALAEIQVVFFNEDSDGAPRAVEYVIDSFVVTDNNPRVRHKHDQVVLFDFEVPDASWFAFGPGNPEVRRPTLKSVPGSDYELEYANTRMGRFGGLIHSMDIDLSKFHWIAYTVTATTDMGRGQVAVEFKEEDGDVWTSKPTPVQERRQRMRVGLHGGEFELTVFEAEQSNFRQDLDRVTEIRFIFLNDSDETEVSAQFRIDDIVMRGFGVSDIEEIYVLDRFDGGPFRWRGTVREEEDIFESSREPGALSYHHHPPNYTVPWPQTEYVIRMDNDVDLSLFDLLSLRIKSAFAKSTSRVSVRLTDRNGAQWRHGLRGAPSSDYQTFEFDLNRDHFWAVGGETKSKIDFKEIKEIGISIFRAVDTIRTKVAIDSLLAKRKCQRNNDGDIDCGTCAIRYEHQSYETGRGTERHCTPPINHCEAVNECLDDDGCCPLGCDDNADNDCTCARIRWQPNPDLIDEAVSSSDSHWSEFGDRIFKVGCVWESHRDTSSCHESFLRFHLQNAPFWGTYIRKAWLKLKQAPQEYGTPWATAGRGHWIRSVDEPWSENHIAYDERPRRGRWEGPSGQYGYWDVTELMQQWMNGSRNNYGVSLYSGDQHHTFWKADGASSITNRPYLDVNYCY